MFFSLNGVAHGIRLHHIDHRMVGANSVIVLNSEEEECGRGCILQYRSRDINEWRIWPQVKPPQQ